MNIKDYKTKYIHTKKNKKTALVASYFTSAWKKSGHILEGTRWVS